MEGRRLSHPSTLKWYAVHDDQVPSQTQSSKDTHTHGASANSCAHFLPRVLWQRGSRLCPEPSSARPRGQGSAGACRAQLLDPQEQLTLETGGPTVRTVGRVDTHNRHAGEGQPGRPKLAQGAPPGDQREVHHLRPRVQALRTRPSIPACVELVPYRSTDRLCLVICRQLI